MKRIDACLAAAVVAPRPERAVGSGARAVVPVHGLPPVVAHEQVAGAGRRRGDQVGPVGTLARRGQAEEVGATTDDVVLTEPAEDDIRPAAAGKRTVPIERAD